MGCLSLVRGATLSCALIACSQPVPPDPQPPAARPPAPGPQTSPGAAPQPPAAPPPLAAYPAPTTQPGGRLVAQIGPVRLTTEELLARMRDASPLTQAKLYDPEQLLGFVNTQIQGELLAQEAWRLGKLRTLQDRDAAVQGLIAQATAGVQPPTHTTLQQLYIREGARYQEPEQIHLTQLLRFTKNPAEQRRARARLKPLRAKLHRQPPASRAAPFEALASAHSQAPDPVNLGSQTRDAVEERYGPEVAAQLFALPGGEDLLLNLPGAVVWVQKTGHRRASKQAFDRVRRQLQLLAQAEARDQALKRYLKQLRAHHRVHVDLRPLGELQRSWWAKLDQLTEAKR